MKIFLAPMDGLTDFYMRDVLTRIGGYDACVTEFIRVTDRLHPARVFFHSCPELHAEGKTAAGTPVHVQLLGSEPAVLAENAARAAELGAPAIDLNFGCPAKIVNKHRGGAILLDEPETIQAIVAAVRRAVPASVPVTAKIRLGVCDRSRMVENAQAVESAGANALVVHARTKEEGYRPPAHWAAIAEIRAQVKLPVMANGEIWTVDDALRCQELSHCTDLMIGRGAITSPALARQLRGESFVLSWTDLVAYQQLFLTAMHDLKDSVQACDVPELLPLGAVWTERGAVGRYKQWLGLLTRTWPQAQPLFDGVKKMQRIGDVRDALAATVQVFEAEQG
jgi:tRNA-dihydrouridine synthase C